MTIRFAAMHESVHGTFRTWPDVRLESAFGGRADVICSERVFPVLTQSGLQFRLNRVLRYLPVRYLEPKLMTRCKRVPSQRARPQEFVIEPNSTHHSGA